MRSFVGDYKQLNKAIGWMPEIDLETGIGATYDIYMIQGFKITNGGNVGNGGGIFFNNAGITLKNLLIKNNTANEKGGGVYVSSNQRLNLYGCTIEMNETTDYGGGLFSYGILKIRNSIINNNISKYGGGIHSISESKIYNTKRTKGVRSCFTVCRRVCW